MSRELARYEAARKALAAATNVDEVRLIRDQSRQLKAAARVAKDRVMIGQATEIQIRAERRLGELLKVTEKANGGRPYQRRSTGSAREPVKPTLAEQGIDKKLSARVNDVLAFVTNPG